MECPACGNHVTANLLTLLKVTYLMTKTIWHCSCTGTTAATCRRIRLLSMFKIFKFPIIEG